MQAKDAEPCQRGAWAHSVRDAAHIAPFPFTTTGLGAAFCSGFNFFFFFSFFSLLSLAFVSRSDISADGQAMTAANGSRALSPVSLATAGRESRSCQMENVNYGGCGGSDAASRGGTGGGGSAAAGCTQQRGDNVGSGHRLPGRGLRRFVGYLVKMSPSSWTRG